MDTEVYLSVVMPCYNEEKNIYNNIKETIQILTEFIDSYEIICVNDGSSDNTLKELRRAECESVKVVTYNKNEGKGQALKRGTKVAKGKYIAFVDSDLELSPRFLKHFFEIMYINNADVVIGSKMHPKSKVDYPWYRKILSFGYFILLKILFRLNIKDTQTGLKLFKAEVIQEVMPQILVKKYAFDIEVLSIINKKGLKIVDAPIELVFGRENVRGRIRFKDICGVFVDTIAIFYRLYILKYYDYVDKKE